MNLPTASAVGFAVSAGQPTDARSWVSVDFDGHLSSLRRGYLVTTEPTEHTVHGREMAAQVREIILGDLRRQQHVPPDIALGRAFARANGYVYGELRNGANASFERRVFVGATAVIIDDHTMTVGHVPPGQMIMIEDGLVYAVPELESWLPTFFANGTSRLGPPDPLGFSAQVRPHLAVTELRAGDVLALTDSRCGEVFAHQIAAQGAHSSEMAGLYGHDPELILDFFRTVVLDNELEDASVAVLALPPLPGSLQIQTLGDIGRRAKDEWRNAIGLIREWTPALGHRPAANPFSSQPADSGRQSGGALKPMIEIPEYSISTAAASAETSGDLPPALGDGLRVRPDPASAERRAGLQERLQRFAERGRPKWGNTWRRPTEVRQFGVPGAHGVQIFRGNSSLMGESSWKNYLPRMPLISAGLLWIVLVCIVATVLLGGAFYLDRRGGDEEDYSRTFAQIDQQIVAALNIEDPAARETALNQASVLIEDARASGAPEDDLRQRELKISAETDVLNNVLRMNGVQRIGSLEEDLLSTSPKLTQTALGTFLVSGSLYQLHPDTRELEKILVEGDVVDSAPVGALFGIAADSTAIYVTDGKHLFVRDGAGEWIATELKELNDLGPWSPGPFDAFSGNVYLLVPSYLNIYKFLANPENGVASAEKWVAGGQDGLDASIDMAIDGNIYVLMEDGSIRTYLRSQLLSTDVPGYISGGQPVALLSGSATGYLYVAVQDPDGTNGRILAFDPVTQVTYQLQLPVGFDTGTDEVMAPFEQLQDIAVDESTGTLYLVNGDSVWSMRYTLPPLAHMQPEEEEAGATPEATP
jgi:hypothetical protein